MALAEAFLVTGLVASRPFSISVVLDLGISEIAAMPAQPEARLHLSIWRPASFQRTYLYGSIDGSGGNGYSLLDQSRVLEQIYAWDPGPHDVLGASTPVVSRRIEYDLLDRFASHRPPSERSVSHFRQALNRLLDDPQVESGTHWSDCQETVTIETGDESNLRSNVTLGVLRHFLWIARVFSQVPEASALVR